MADSTFHFARLLIWFIVAMQLNAFKDIAKTGLVIKTVIPMIALPILSYGALKFEQMLTETDGGDLITQHKLVILSLLTGISLNMIAGYLP
jgi:hypothetical protein